MSGRKDFLSQPAPENYVAGLGRGATGFTTRSDLGPAREGPSEDQIKEALAKRAQQLGAAPPTAYGATEKKEEADDDDERYQDPENETGLFANGVFDAEDDYADRVYQEIEDKMQSRRKSRRYAPCLLPQFPCPLLCIEQVVYMAPLSSNEQITDLKPSATYREAREAKERAEYEANNPKIQQQFADLKRSLASVTTDEWAALPEVGDLTRKNKRAKTNARNRFYAVPDSVIAGARDSTEFNTSVTEDGAATNGSKSDAVDGTMTNFADIGAARDKVLQVRLDQAAQSGGTDSTSGTSTNIDPKGYLTSLSKTELKAGEVEVGDINRVKALLESVIRTNPRHAPGHIALSRLHELAGKIVAARNAIARCCELCPNSEDAWLENVRLNESDLHNAKIIAANAVRQNETSTRLWMQAADLETEVRAKQNVLRKALDVMGNSSLIWKKLISLSDEESAKLLLSKACETLPMVVDFPLALARIETPENAQKVLNAARIRNPKSHLIWLAAAKLAESTGGKSKVNIVKRAVASLAREDAMLKREEWIQEAETSEEEGFPAVCRQIVEETLSYGLDDNDEDLKQIFLDDAQQSAGRGKYETARAIYAYTLRLFPTSKSAYMAAIELERTKGTKEASWQLMEKSVEACPDVEALWLLSAKSRWDAGMIDEARRILGRAFNQLSDKENVFLFAVKLEAENGNINESRELLSTARREAGTDRVYYKSVAFERQHHGDDLALDLCIEGLNQFPGCPKLWMQKGQIYVSQNKLPQAREAYSTGVRACPKSVPLYLLWSRLEVKTGVIVKARSVLDRGRLALDNKSPELWLESVRVERKAGNVAQAKVLMAQALQNIGTSGILWSESIWYLEPRTQRKPRSLEAIKKCENDPALFVTVARVFWGERKLDKAANWFEKSVLLDPDQGDTWAWYFKFLVQHGTEEKRAEVLEKCRANEPKHGEVWAGVAKDPKNAGLGVEQVLRKVVDVLE